MDSEARRLVVALCAALAVFLGYQLVVAYFFPQAQPATSTTTTPPPPATPLPASERANGAPPPLPATAAAATAPGAALSLVAATEEVGPLLLGGRDGDALRLTLTPRGAALSRIELCARNDKGRFVHRAKIDSDEPYELLSPVPADEPQYYSFATYRVSIREYDNQSWRLDTLPWEVAEHSPDKTVFTTALRSADGRELLRFRKSYTLQPGKPVLGLDLVVQNAGSEPLTIWIDQDGPIGIRQEHLQYDMRQLLTAQASTSGPHLGKGYRHGDLLKATKADEPPQLLAADHGPLLWTALTNKYFAVFTRPLPTHGDTVDYVAGAVGLVADETATKNAGDLLARIATTPTTLQPAADVRYPFEIYAGSKDGDNLRKVNAAYAGPTLQYQLTQSADRRCACTFQWLQELMVWLLEKIYLVVRNYGVAIIILVLIVRGALHRLTVFQQKSMFRMQEAMARIQPKLNAIKEKYANDKVRLNQEMMKIWGEEGVNPVGQFVSFLPLMIQMPILVALWTALNTDVNLRHAAFLPWWITDLSAPDAIWSFPAPGLTIPVLSLFPLIGSWFTNIPAVNLLPILMGVSMWLQQKYMPKPHMQAKLEAAKQQPTKSRSGLSPEDQLRQQQIMMYMMTVMFPLMFYYMPSGLNLYWMATNVFGIGESLIIRKQLDKEKAERARLGPQPPKKPGLVSKFFKHIAAQAEEVQRRADALAKSDEGRKRKDK